MLIGGIVMEGQKFHTLAYADELAIIAKGKEKMRNMVKEMEKYLDTKVILNAKKAKMTR